jgi:hypothetical protein
VIADGRDKRGGFHEIRPSPDDNHYFHSLLVPNRHAMQNSLRAVDPFRTN